MTWEGRYNPGVPSCPSVDTDPSEVKSVMRRLMRASFVLVAALIPGSAPAQEPPAEQPELRLSLEDAVKRTLENNTDIAVERFNPEDSAEQVRQVQGASRRRSARARRPTRRGTRSRAATR